MKKLLICLLFSTSCYADTWLQQMGQPDKVGHYASGATLTAVGSIFFNPEVGLALAVAAAIATILGGVLVYAAIKNDKIKVSYFNNTPIISYNLALR